MEFRKLIKTTTFNIILNKYLRFYLSKAQKKKRKEVEAVTTAPMYYRAASEYGTGINWPAEKK